MSAEPDMPQAHIRRWPVFIPLLILTFTFVAWTLFQTIQLVRERDVLTRVHSNQQKQVDESKKLRDGLDNLARETQLLANRGNKGAGLVVDELRKRGITINPEAPPPPGSAPGSPVTPAK